MITFIGLIITIFGSYYIFQGDFLTGGIIVGLGTILDSIDGAMARLSNKESVFGDLLDSVIDRYGEAAIFLSLACYYLFNSLDEIAVLLCIISMLCSQLISYVRAKSESLDIENKSGFLGPLFFSSFWFFWLIEPTAFSIANDTLLFIFSLFLLDLLTKQLHVVLQIC